MAVNLTFDKAIITEDNPLRITLPVTLDADVRKFGREHISITPDTTNPIYDMYINVEKTSDSPEWDIILEFPLDYSGTLQLEGNGVVYRSDIGLYDTIISPTQNIPYNTIIPFVEYHNLHAVLTKGILNLFIVFNVPIKNISVNSLLTEGVSTGPTKYLFRFQDDSLNLNEDWSNLPDNFLDSDGMLDISNFLSEYPLPSSSGITWISKGDLTSVPGISTIGMRITVGTEFPSNPGPNENDILIFSADNTISGNEYSKGDIFQYDGATWMPKGDLTSVPGISTIGIRITVGTEFPSNPEPNENDILIFSEDNTISGTEYSKGDIFQVALSDNWINETGKTTVKGKYFVFRYDIMEEGSLDIILPKDEVFNAVYLDENIGDPDSGNRGYLDSGNAGNTNSGNSSTGQRISLSYTVAGITYQRSFVTIQTMNQGLPALNSIFDRASFGLVEDAKTIGPTNRMLEQSSIFNIGTGVKVGSMAQIGVLWSPFYQSNIPELSVGDTVVLNSSHMSFTNISDIQSVQSADGETWLYFTADVRVDSLPTNVGDRISLSYTVAGLTYERSFVTIQRTHQGLPALNSIFDRASFGLVEGAKVIRPINPMLGQSSIFNIGTGVKVGSMAQIGVLWSPFYQSNIPELSVGDTVVLNSSHMSFTNISDIQSVQSADGETWLYFTADVRVDSLPSNT